MISRLSVLARRPEREHDLVLGTPASFTTVATYELPAGWTVDVPPANGEVKTPEVAFTFKATQDGQVLTSTRRAELKATRVGKGAYPAFREALNRAASLGRQRWKIKRGGG